MMYLYKPESLGPRIVHFPQLDPNLTPTQAIWEYTISIPLRGSLIIRTRDIWFSIAGLVSPKTNWVERGEERRTSGMQEQQRGLGRKSWHKKKAGEEDESTIKEIGDIEEGVTKEECGGDDATIPGMVVIDQFLVQHNINLVTIRLLIKLNFKLQSLYFFYICGRHREYTCILTYWSTESVFTKKLCKQNYNSAPDHVCREKWVMHC